MHSDLTVVNSLMQSQRNRHRLFKYISNISQRLSDKENNSFTVKDIHVKKEEEEEKVWEILGFFVTFF